MVPERIHQLGKWAGDPVQHIENTKADKLLAKRLQIRDARFEETVRISRRATSTMPTCFH